MSILAKDNRLLFITVSGDGHPRSGVVRWCHARRWIALEYYGEVVPSTDLREEQGRWDIFNADENWSTDQDGLPFEFVGVSYAGGSLRAFFINDVVQL